MSSIQQIQTQLAPYEYLQAKADNFTESNMALHEDRRMSLFFRALKKRSGVAKRYSCLPPEYFEENSPLGRLSTGQRQELYTQNASLLIEKLCQKLKLESKLDNLITVSCTGYQTPGLDFMLLDKLGLSSSPFRYNIGAMGCYAGITGLRLANQLPGNSLLLCLEFCSLHFQSEPLNFSTLTSNSLFADGACLVQVSEKGFGQLRALSFHSERIPATTDKMGWFLKDRGFVMHLDPSVPELIGQTIGPATEAWLAQEELTINQIDHWVVHPGGLSILEAVREGLQLPLFKLEASYRILENCGNMSSGTVFFILKDLLESGLLKSGQKVAMLAFGPGLSAEMALLEAT